MDGIGVAWSAELQRTESMALGGAAFEAACGGELEGGAVDATDSELGDLEEEAEREHAAGMALGGAVLEATGNGELDGGALGAASSELEARARRAGVEMVARRVAAACGTAAVLDGLPVEVARGLQAGSADPHMLREPGEVTEPRWSTHRGMFSIDRLDPADPEELCLRPFPDLNPSPETDARVEPEAPLPDAPVVSAVEDVVPVETVKRLRRWERRVRACLKAARRGNPSLARQLRPPDLELRAGEHTVSGMDRWVWDLRPLSRGERAVPLAGSSRSSPPATNLDLAAVERLGEHYPDKAIVSEMLMGFSDDAVDVEQHIVLSPPHLGALRYAAEARAKVAKDVGKGWSAIEPNLPFWPVRVNPYSIVREERESGVKHRMTIDLSWPRASAGERDISVNGSIDRSEWVQVRMLRITQVAELVAILRTSGEEVLLWSFDCVAYYRMTGRQRSEVWRNCVAVEEGFVVDEREQFGDASAAVKCVRQSSFLAWLIRRAMQRVDAEFPPTRTSLLRWLEARRQALGASVEEPELGSCGMYVDDGGGASINDVLVDKWGAVLRRCGPDEHGTEGAVRGAPLRRAAAHFAAATAALRETGEESEESKECAPRRELVLLGMELSVIGEGRMRLSEHKRVRYAARAEAVLAREEKVCGREEFEALVHRLLFASYAMPVGRQFLHSLFCVLKAKFRLAGDRVMVTARVRKALGWWVAHLGAAHEGVPLACRGLFPAAGEEGVVVLYSDASGGFGFGGWAAWGQKVFYVAGAWSSEERDGIHINVKELFAMAAALASLVPATGARYAVEFTDNTVAQGAARRLAPSAHLLQMLVARRVQWLRENGVFSAVARVGTKENLWADLISRRGGEAVFLEQVWALGMEPVKVEVDGRWRDASYLRGAGADPA